MAHARSPGGRVSGRGCRLSWQARDAPHGNAPGPTGNGRIVADKGLREVIAADTKLSDIDGEQGTLSYVGYQIEDLAEHASFEEVVHLLHHLRLPTTAELDADHAVPLRERGLHPFLVRLMPTLAEQTSPMSMLRTSVSAASAFDPDGWDESPEAQARKALRLIAQTASLITTYHRQRTGLEIVTPNPDLPHAADFLWMLHGDRAEPGGRPRARRDLRPVRGPHDERLDVHREDRGLHARGHVLGDHRRDRHAEGPAPRRRERGVDEELRGGRQARERRGVRPRPPRAAREDLRVRTRRVQDVRPARPRAEGAVRGDRRAAGKSKIHEIAEAIEVATFEQKGLYPNVDFYAAAVFHLRWGSPPT